MPEEALVINPRGFCGAVMRVSWYGHEGVVVRSRGCRGTVTRVSWCGHEGVMNHLRQSAERWADAYDSSVLCQLLYYC